MKYKEKKHLKSAWIGKASEEDQKSWGTEIIWGAFNSIRGKVLSINKGGKTSLKQHVHKNEVFYVMSGKVSVFYGNEASLTDPVAYPFAESVLQEGDVLCVQSNCPYQIVALEDSKLIEIGDKTTDGTIYLDEAEIRKK